MAVAQSWEAARGLPREIASLLGEGAELLLAIPEYKVELPGRGAANQCDVFALVRIRKGTVAIAIEAKVDEPFGPTVADWLVGASDGKAQRLQALTGLLGIGGRRVADIRYQLLHRSAAAILEAKRFGCDSAAMIVQSFSAQDACFEDYASFAELIGIPAEPDAAATIELSDGLSFTLGWARGDGTFLKSLARSAT